MSTLWPLVPNWSRGVRESYEFLTEIITSRNGKEQRRALRSTPRRMVEYESVVVNDALLAMEGLLARKQTDLLQAGDFVRNTRLASALPASANSVTVTSVPTWLAPGALVVVSQILESTMLEVSTVVGSTVTFSSPSPKAFSAGALLSCTVAGYLQTEVQSTRETNTVATVSTRFQPDPATEAIDEGALNPEMWFDGREVFVVRPNWSRAPTITYSSDIETVDYGRGRIARFRPVPFGTNVRQATFLARTEAEMETIRRFFNRMKGRRGEFYSPSWNVDMTLAAEVPAMTTQMRIVGRQVYDDYKDDESRRSILIENKDGSTTALKFSSITLDGTTSVLHLSETYPFVIDPADVKLISWMALSRFASDTLTVEWLTDEVAQCVLSVTSVEYAEAEPSDLGDLDDLTLYMLSTFGWSFTEDVLCDPLQWAVNVKYPIIAEV